METIPTKDLKFTTKKLFLPSLELAANVLQQGLQQDFQEVSVNVVECPDLSKSPFHMAGKGLCGHPCLVDMGGVPNLMPVAKKEKLYDIKSIAEVVHGQHREGNTGSEGQSLMIGAGAAPWPHKNKNGELVPNLLTDSKGSKVLNQETRVAFTKNNDKDFFSTRIPEEETRFSMLGNFLISQGQSGGKILEIKCSKRKQNGLNFVSAMRRTLKEAFPEESVGAGGTFLVKKGKVKVHVMPGEFSSCPLTTDEAVNEWLKFFEVEAPFTCMSVFISNDPGLDLRVEHSHGFNEELKLGGHYHIDTTPDEVEYLGYYNLAEEIYRIDPPEETHNIGRD